METNAILKNENRHIIFVLDESSSMNSCKQMAINGLNEMVTAAKTNCANHGENVKVTLVTFNTEPTLKFKEKDGSLLKTISNADYQPNGMTALNDAIGLAMDTIIDDGSSTYLVNIVSDGFENASRNYDGPQIKSRIQELESTERWTFTFVGMDIDMMDINKNYGIKRDNMLKQDKLSYAAGNVKMSGRLNVYLNNVRAGVSRGTNFVSDQEGALCSIDKDGNEVEEKI